MIEVHQYSPQLFDSVNSGAMSEDIMSWSLLWVEEWDSAGIESIFLAWDEDDNIIGFQTVNSDNKTVAIEVRECYQGQGIASKLVEASESYTPEANENPEFWDAIAEKYYI